MKGQYEEECNAAPLQKLGISRLNHIDDGTLTHIGGWINSDFSSNVNYENNLKDIVETILKH